MVLPMFRIDWRKSLAWIPGVDWRVGAVLAAYVISIAGTLLIYYYDIWGKAKTATIFGDPATHVGAVFAGWVAGLVLFTIGGVAALVSLARPERESFDSRARILFR